MENRYSVTVMWSENDAGFIATVQEFPGLSAFGETKEEAVHEAEIALELFVEDIQAEGAQLPECKQRSSYSGNIRLRIPKSTHRQVAELADLEGVSMNSMISLLIERSLSENRIAHDVCTHIDRKFNEMRFFARIPEKIVVTRGAASPLHEKGVCSSHVIGSRSVAGSEVRQ